MSQVINSKKSGLLFSKKAKVDPRTKSWYGCLSMPGTPNQSAPIDFGGEAMGWMPDGFTNAKPLKLKKTRHPKELKVRPNTIANHNPSMLLEYGLISTKSTAKSLKSLFKKTSWTKLPKNPTPTSSPPVSPEPSPPPLVPESVLDVTAPPVSSSGDTMPFEITYSQSVRKLRSHRRPLLQMILIQHVIGRLHSTQKSLFTSPNRLHHKSWPRSPPRSAAPLIDISQHSVPSSSEEDDDVPIGLLKCRPIAAAC